MHTYRQTYMYRCAHTYPYPDMQILVNEIMYTYADIITHRLVCTTDHVHTQHIYVYRLVHRLIHFYMYTMNYRNTYTHKSTLSQSGIYTPLCPYTLSEKLHKWKKSNLYVHWNRIQKHISIHAHIEVHSCILAHTPVDLHKIWSILSRTYMQRYLNGCTDTHTYTNVLVNQEWHAQRFIRIIL